jgi:urease accessory protein
VDGGETPGTGAVALGATASVLGIPKESALLMFCHSHAVSVLGAAMRLLPMTHSQAQQVLHSLHETIIDLGKEAMQRPWQEMAAFTPALDLASMLHETDDLRLFAS